MKRYLILSLSISLLLSGVAFGAVFYFSILIVNVEHNKERNTVEITYQQPNVVCVSGTTCPDHIWKDIYGVRKGRIVFLKEIKGRHIPEKTIPEEFIFDEVYSEDGLMRREDDHWIPK